MSSEAVIIDVFNRSFTVAAPPSEKDTLLQALDLLKQKIAVVQGGGKNLDNDRIVVLAALNVIHDLLKAAPDKGLADSEIESRMAAVLEVCEKALAKAGN